MGLARFDAQFGGWAALVSKRFLLEKGACFARGVEVAYLFGPAEWGQGYAAEALGWLHRYLRPEHEVAEFWATVAPTNERSKRVLLRSAYRVAAHCDARPLGSFDAGDEVFRCDHANALAAMWARGE